MRTWLWTLVVMGLSRSVIFAQLAEQPATPGSPPNSGRLDTILMSWEQAMSSIKSASAQCTHTVVDKVLKDKLVFEGTAQFMKPNMAVLDLKMKSPPQDIEHGGC